MPPKEECRGDPLRASKLELHPALLSIQYLQLQKQVWWNADPFGAHMASSDTVSVIFAWLAHGGRLGAEREAIS